MSRLSAISPRLFTAVQPRRGRGRPAGLTLREVNDHPEGAAALDELESSYVISEAAGGLLLSQRDAECRLFLYDLDGFLGAARRNAARRQHLDSAELSSRRYSIEDIVPGRFDLASAREVIARLEDRIARLRGIRKELSDQREQWRQRAILAEARLKGLDATDQEGDEARYQALRRFLARQLHPDHTAGSEAEKALRGEIFKAIWGEISRLDASGR